MKVSFTGTQQGMTEFQKFELKQRLIELRCTEFINGSCIGADYEATMIALETEVDVIHLFPSDLGPKRAPLYPDIPDDTKPHNVGDMIVIKEIPEKPLIRNKKIVEACEMLIACPKEHQHSLRSGTWATIRYAWHKKKNVLIIPPIVREDNE